MADTIKPKSKLDIAIEEFEQETADCKVIRKELVTQLRDDVKKMRVTEFDKAMMVTAKMSIVTTLNSMLKDIEDSTLKKVKMRMSRNDQENSGQYSQAIVQLLKMVRADGRDITNSSAPKQTDEDVQKKLKDHCKELDIKTTPGELETCSGAPGESTVDPRENEESTPSVLNTTEDSPSEFTFG